MIRRFPDWLGVRECGVEVLRQQILCQRQHFGEGARRLLMRHPEGGQHPGAVLVKEHAQPQRLVVRGARDHHLLGDQPFRHAELVCGVIDPDVDSRLRGALITPLVQPHRQPGATTGRVDHQIGGDELRLRTGDRRVQQHAGNPLQRGFEARLGDRALHNLDVVDLQDAAPDLPLQVRAAGHVGGELVAQGVPGSQDVAGGAQVNAVRAVLQHGHACRHHVVQQAGEQTLEFVGAARHQHVQVAVLGDGGAVGRTARQVVPLEDRDPFVEVGQHPGRGQPGNARADHYRMILVLYAPHHARRVPSTVRTQMQVTEGAG